MALTTAPPDGVVLKEENIIYNYKNVRTVWQVNDDDKVVKMRSSDLDSPQDEMASTRFVEEHCPSIPVPLVHDEWLSADDGGGDGGGKRHYMLMSRVGGLPLTRAWDLITDTEKLILAEDVLGHMRTLREFRSDRMLSVAGTRLRNNRFVPGEGNVLLPAEGWTTDDDIFDQAFRPKLEEIKISERRMAQIRRCMPPCVGQFALYHGDLYTGNIMVDMGEGEGEGRGEEERAGERDRERGDDVAIARLAGIIDWEMMGYWPMWFHYARLRWRVNEDDGLWKRVLSIILERDEIPHATHGLVWWHALKVLMVENPRSRRARDWLDLLQDHLEGYELVVPLRRYETYRSADYK